MVKKMLPAVSVLLLPEEPSAYRSVLEEQAFFDTVFLSEEDKKRSQMYKAEQKRKEAKVQFKPSDIDDYLGYLQMELSIGRADSFYIPRIAQLTQRTNQFNLTTKRYTEANIKDLAEKDNSDVFYVILKDRFGDTGAVGVVILLYESKNAFINTFLLSCRVIGRGVEEAMLKVCIDEARQKECENIYGIYIPTRKNHLVESFYEKNGFSKIESEKEKMIYGLSLNKAHMMFPSYFKLIKVGDIEYTKGEEKK